MLPWVGIDATVGERLCSRRWVDVLQGADGGATFGERLYCHMGWICCKDWTTTAGGVARSGRQGLEVDLRRRWWS
jgi:hypothetical protein